MNKILKLPRVYLLLAVWYIGIPLWAFSLEHQRLFVDGYSIFIFIVQPIALLGAIDCIRGIISSRKERLRNE